MKKSYKNETHKDPYYNVINWRKPNEKMLHQMSCSRNQKNLRKTISIMATAFFIASVGFQSLVQLECSPRTASSPVAHKLTRSMSFTQKKPKLNAHPVIQLDMGNKYYKALISGAEHNFKQAVARASQMGVHSMANATSWKPISLIESGLSKGKQQRVKVQNLQIEGVDKPKVARVYVNKRKLHVVFAFKNIRVSGECVASGTKNQTTSDSKSRKVQLLQVSNWSSAWSADVMQMVGRDHFDMSTVETAHSQQRTKYKLEACPRALHEKMKLALLERVRSSIDSRLVDIMERVMLRTDTLIDEETPVAAAPKKSRARRNPLLEGGKARVLKRTKRQTPCEPGEDLDDYVDDLFRVGSKFIKAMEPMKLPNTTIELPDYYNFKIFLYEGKGTRIWKFRRAKSAWVFCSNETLSLGVTIQVEQMRVAYKYRVITGNRLIYDGDLEARLSPRIQAQYSEAVLEEDSEEEVQKRIDRVKVFRLGNVDTIIRGLGNLSQSLAMIINGWMNDRQEDLQPFFRMFEGDAVILLNRILNEKVNMPLLAGGFV